MSEFCVAIVTDWSTRSPFASTTPSSSGPVTAPSHRNSAACRVARRDEVMAVTGIVPDFVSASEIRNARQDRPAMLIDDREIAVTIGRLCIAAEQDLIMRANSHTLRAGAGVERNRKAFLDLHSLAIDNRNCSWHGIIPGRAVHRWNVLIKFPGLLTVRALLEAVGGLQGCVPAAEPPSNMSLPTTL